MKITIDSFLTKNIYNSMQILNNTISNNITHLIIQILTSYKYVSKENEDIYRSYIYKYIQCNIIKHICQISKLVINRTSSYTDKESIQYLSNLRSYSEIIEKIYKVAFDNKNLLIVNDSVSEVIYKEWHEADQYKECQGLFKSKEDYLYKNISLYDFLDSINIPKLKNLPSVGSLLIFISEAQKKTKKEEIEDNLYIPLFSFERSLTEKLFLYSKNKEKQSINIIMKNHVKSQECIEDYILEKAVNPLVAEIINKFDNANKINIKEVNEYINLKYRNSFITYNEILLPSTLLNKNDKNTKILDVVLEKLYLDSLYKQSKDLLCSNQDNKVNGFNLLSTEFKDFYKNEMNYNNLLLSINNTWVNDENLINSIKKSFEEKIKYKENEIKKISRELKSSEPSKLYTTLQKIYNNRRAIITDIAIVTVLVCVYMQGRKVSNILTNFEGMTKDLKDTSGQVNLDVRNTSRDVSKNIRDISNDVGKTSNAITGNIRTVGDRITNATDVVGNIKGIGGMIGRISRCLW